MQRPSRIAIIGTGREEESVGWQLAYKVCELIDEYNILEEYRQKDSITGYSRQLFDSSGNESSMSLDDFISKRKKIGLPDIEPHEILHEGRYKQKPPVRPHIIHLDFCNRTEKHASNRTEEYARMLKDKCANMLKHDYSRRAADETLRIRSIEEICRDYTFNDTVFICIDASNYREGCKKGELPKLRQECLEPNKDPIINLAKEFKKYEDKHKYRGTIVMVTNPTDICAYLFAVYSGIHPNRIIGFAPETERYLRIVRGIYEDKKLIEWFNNAMMHVKNEDWPPGIIKSIAAIRINDEYTYNRKSIFTKEEIPLSIIEGLIFGEHGLRICAIESCTRIQGHPAIPNVFRKVVGEIETLGEYILAGAENNLWQIDKEIGAVLTACALNRFDKERTSAHEIAPMMKKLILSTYKRERFCASTFLRFSQVKASQKLSYILPEYLNLMSAESDHGRGNPGIYTGYLIEPTLSGFRAVEDDDILLVHEEFAEFLKIFRQIYNSDFKPLHQSGVPRLDKILDAIPLETKDLME